MNIDLEAIENMSTAEICETALATHDTAYFWLLAGYAAGRIASVNFGLALQSMAAGRAWDEEATKETLRAILACSKRNVRSAGAQNMKP
jgi:hypothetical protein